MRIQEILQLSEKITEEWGRGKSQCPWDITTTTGNALHHHPTWKVEIAHVSLTIGESLHEHVYAFAQVAL